MKLHDFRKELVKLDENEIKIDFEYNNFVFFRRLLGLYKVNVNEYSFQRALRFTDIDGRLPSFKSAIRYPSILIKYAFQKITKKYTVNNPKPFLVVDAVHHIKKHIKPDFNVLEVGAGNSTLWFLKNSCNVISIEHNVAWGLDIKKRSKEILDQTSAELKLEICCGQEAFIYMEEIDKKFDVILIDSMNEYTSRYESIKILQKKLSKNGILVLDNSDGVVNWKAVAEMYGVKSKIYTGYAYNSPFVCQTTIWNASDIISYKNTS